MHVLIIGAGTGGLALAHGLKQSRIEVSVFERYRGPDEDQGGYRVGISPAGSRALKACVPASLYELFVGTCARAPRYFNMLTEQFAELLCLDLQRDGVDMADGERNVIRSTLRQVLLTGLEDSVHFGKRFVRYEERSDGTVTAFFDDGSSATGDLLVGADGAGSRVRKQRLPQARHEETGIVSIGGKLPMTTQSRALLTDRMFNGMSLIMAPKGFGAIIHSLDFSQKRANTDFMVRWPQFQSCVDNDSIGWGLWGAKHNFVEDPTILGADGMLRLAEELTATWHPHMRQLIQMTAPSMAQCISIRTSVPPEPWESSNVTLLGDAVHTMTPGRGAGANTALRDAELLSGLLREVHRGTTPLFEGIHAYESEMLRYSSEAVFESRKQMDSNDSIHKPVIGRMQLAVMRAGMRLVNSAPMLRRRVIRNIMRVRGSN
jgi:2-polyprenyl-6-methoxyphenol hydroxylase-like FAD-dependent oxidoreductase